MVGNANSIRVHSICLRNRAVLVSQQERLQVNNLVPEHCGLVLEVLVVCREVLDLGLQVGQPLFLSLAALESSY